MLVVGAGNSASEIAVELSEVAAEVQLSVRTPPNIVRRATLGVPSQLIAVALRRAPEWVMNPMSALLRRLTVPDLSAYGLPAPGRDGFSQYRRSRVIPILDHGFVDAVRAGRITIVSAVQSFDGAEVRLDDGRTVLARRGRRRHRLSTGSGRHPRRPAAYSTNRVGRECTARARWRQRPGSTSSGSVSSCPVSCC